MHWGIGDGGRRSDQSAHRRAASGLITGFLQPPLSDPPQALGPRRLCLRVRLLGPRDPWGGTRAGTGGWFLADGCPFAVIKLA